MNDRQRWKEALEQGAWSALDGMLPQGPAKEPGILLEVDSQGRSALEKACMEPRALGHALKLCEALDAYGMSLSAEATQEVLDRSLRAAAERQRGDELLGALLDAGAMIDSSDPVDGATALHRALRSGNLESAAALVQAGADPTLRDAQGVDAVGLINEGGSAMAPVIVAVMGLALKDMLSGAPDPDQNAMDEVLAQERLRRQEIMEESLRASSGVAYDALSQAAKSAAAADQITPEAVVESDALFGRLIGKLGERRAGQKPDEAPPAPKAGR
jgi:hypothetical protein